MGKKRQSNESYSRPSGNTLLVGRKPPASLVNECNILLETRGVDKRLLQRDIRKNFRREVHKAYRQELRKRIQRSYTGIQELVRASDKSRERWSEGSSPIKFEFLFEAIAATRTTFMQGRFDGRPVLPDGQTVLIDSVCDTVTLISRRIGSADHVSCRPLDWAITFVAGRPFWTKVAESIRPSSRDKKLAVMQLSEAVRNLVHEFPRYDFEEINQIKGTWIVPLALFHVLIDLKW